MTDIGQLVRSANPVSGDRTLTDDELDALLLLVDARSGSMDTKERLAPAERQTPRRGPWRVAAAAFAAVLLVGVAILLASPGGGSTAPADQTPPTTGPPVTTTTSAPATTTTPPTTIGAIVETPTVDLDSALAAATAHVAGFVDAVNAGVAGEEIKAAYFPAEEALGCGPTPSSGACDSPAMWQAPFLPTYMDEWFDHLVAVDTIYEIEECRNTDQFGTVTCELASTSPHEPFYPGHRSEQFRLRLDGDRVDYAALVGVSEIEWKLPELEFWSWLLDTQPEVASSTYTATGLSGWALPDITSGSAKYSANLIEYVPQWRDAVEAGWIPRFDLTPGR